MSQPLLRPTLAVLTPKQAARMKGVTTRCIYRAIKEGRIGAIPVGDPGQPIHFLISVAELSLFCPRVYRRRPRKRRWHSYMGPRPAPPVDEQAGKSVS